ncbi:MAG: DUF523 domain-containing protein [Desulfovibrionales bacterium]|nr:DUF523 domain-containing protein [Desulfovibrionales bacterium]
MIKYVVSACLAGCNCRYDGSNTVDEEIQALIKEGKALPVCPEQLGGFATPRIPFELVGDRAYRKDGVDITERMEDGVIEAEKLVKLAGCTHAILQPRSPSCGFGSIYDGSFTGDQIEGHGLFAQRLIDMGLTVSSAKQ